MKLNNYVANLFELKACIYLYVSAVIVIHNIHDKTDILAGQSRISLNILDFRI